HGEEAHGGEVHAEQVMVRKTQQLGSAFAGGVGGQRAIGMVVFDEGHALRTAIGRRGGSEDEVRLAVLFGGVQQVERTGEVHIVVEPRIFDRNAHAGHGGQVGNGVEGVVLKELIDQRAIANVAADEIETSGPSRVDSLDFIEVGQFARRVVIIVEVVEPHDVIAALEQTNGGMAADEAGSTRN